MAKSKIRTAAQRALGGIDGSMAELMSKFGTEGACDRHVLSLRRPTGFECPRCGNHHWCLGNRLQFSSCTYP